MKHCYLLLTALMVALIPTAGAVEVTLLAHNSFLVNEQVIFDFENETGIDVKVVISGDSGATVNQAIRDVGNPTADVIYTVDNVFLSRALGGGIVEAYESSSLADVPTDLQFDSSKSVMPIDFGYICINYDKAYMSTHNMTPPTSFENLTEEQWKGKLVVENPATSSTGLGFLLATIDYFGEDGYLEFWAELVDNDLKVTDGWTEAYYTDFTPYGGDRPLVLSYATSPAAEVFFADTSGDPANSTSPAPTGNVLGEKMAFRLIEGVALLKGAAQPAEAKMLIDFMMSARFQENFTTTMWVYPANSNAQLPPVFSTADIPTSAQIASVAPSLINDNLDAWLLAWQEVVIEGDAHDEGGFLPGFSLLTSLFALLMVMVVVARYPRRD